MTCRMFSFLPAVYVVLYIHVVSRLQLGKTFFNLHTRCHFSDTALPDGMSLV